MGARNLTALSRVVSHALRHEPWLYEIELDEEGWTALEPLLVALRRAEPDWHDLGPADIAAMIAGASKQRHELRDGRIRALYGHSLAGKLLRQPAAPPDALYHGTAPDLVDMILSEGLRPMSRQ